MSYIQRTIRVGFRLSAIGTVILGAAAIAPVRAAMAQSAAAGSDQGATLQEVVVTAQKRREDIQTVPISMTAIGQEALERLHATQLADFAGYIPSLQMEFNGTPAQGSISLRGIPPLGSGATIANYLDETPLNGSSLYGNASAAVLDLLPFDIQSVEVLRGPQGTLYGANALGGLIKYVTKLPDLDHVSGRLGGDTFSLDGAGKAGYGGHANINLPILPGRLAVSASFAREQTPGIIDNALSGAKSQNPYSEQVGRLALLWKPNDDISLSLSGIQQKVEADNNTYVALEPVSLQPIYGKLKNNNILAEPSTQDLDYFSATLNVNLGWADLVSATSYSNTRFDSVTDASLLYGVLFPVFGAPAGKSAFDLDVQLRKTTEEIRLASKPGDTFEWLVGGFYDHEGSENNQLVTAQSFDGAPIPGLDPLENASVPSLYREYAFFGDLTYKFNRSFDVSAGLRWSRNDQDFKEISSGSILPPATTPGSSSQSVVTYSAGPRWHITPDTMAYARVASGYQPGGPNVVVPGVPPEVAADKLTNYEVGLKTTLDDRRLQVDVAAFYIDWTAIQVNHSNGVVSYLVNGGTASSEGFELSTLYMPVEGLRLGLNAAYADAKLTEDVPSINGVSGDPLPYVAKWTGSATADYAFLQRAGWTARVGGGLRLTGKRESDLAHSPYALPLSSYGALDLNAEVSNDRWTIRLFSKNVTNRVVYVSEFPVNNGLTGATTQVEGVPLEPRTIGVGVDWTF